MGEVSVFFLQAHNQTDRQTIKQFLSSRVQITNIEINPDKLCVNLFKGFDFTGVQSFHFSHRKLTSPL